MNTEDRPHGGTEAQPARRAVLRGMTRMATALGAAAILPSGAWAQGGRPVRIILPVSAGSGADGVARVMSGGLSRALGHPTVVENLPGAGGITGTTQIVRGAKDGSVIGFVSNNHVVNPSVYRNVPFDAIEDITPITVIGATPFVLVAHPGLAAKNVPELVALAKAQPGALNYGSSGNGTILHLAAELGFNLVRKHLKFEEPRWLYAADRMGMLVWAEPASTSRFTEASAAAFEQQIAPMVERDGNHPSVIIWGLYNEEWGLDWDIPGSASRAAAASRAYDLLRAIDSSRPVVENSGWSHVRSDLVDWHYYDEDPAAWAENVRGLADGSRHDWSVRLGTDFVVDKSLYGSQEFPRTGVPLINSEYGAGFTSLERAWHVRWQTQELRRHDRFAGYVYTELADVEHEAAGLFDADRRRKDWGGLDPADANAETVIVVDLIPRWAGADLRMPAAALEIDMHVSHHGPAALVARVHAAWAPAGARFGEREVAATTVTDEVVAQPFVLSGPVTVRVGVPPAVESARLLLWLVDESGMTRARTFVDAGPIEEPNRRGARVPH